MNSRNFRLIGLLVIVAVVVGVAGPRVWRWSAAPPSGHCPICLRHEHKDSLVRFKTDGGRVTEACCLSCALNYGRQVHKSVTIVSVTDHETRKPLDPDKASYVVGSDVSPCTHLHENLKVGSQAEEFPVHWDRCMPNILAFGSQQSAEAFRTAHGGRLRTLEELKRPAAATELFTD